MSMVRLELNQNFERTMDIDLDNLEEVVAFISCSIKDCIRKGLIPVYLILEEEK